MASKMEIEPSVFIYSESRNILAFTDMGMNPSTHVYANMKIFIHVGVIFFMAINGHVEHVFFLGGYPRTFLISEQFWTKDTSPVAVRAAKA